MKTITTTIITLLTCSACYADDFCLRVEGPSLVLDQTGPTGCWEYTGEPNCYPTRDDESPCDAKRDQFRTGDRLTLWCTKDVTSPKAVMVPVECDPQ